MSRVLSGVRYEELKEAVADLVEDYALSYPLDPFIVAQLLGLEVRFHSGLLPFEPGMAATHDGYTTSSWTKEGHRFDVHLLDNSTPVRTRFTMAHEIGHVWLDHLLPTSNGSEEVQEREANFFAGYLLAPDVMVASMQSTMSVEGIAAKFELSSSAAGFIFKRFLRAINQGPLTADYDLRIQQASTWRVDEVESAPPRVRGESA